MRLVYDDGFLAPHPALVWGATGFFSGSSGVASKILCAKTGQGAYIDLILIHTKFEKKIMRFGRC